MDIASVLEFFTCRAPEPDIDCVDANTADKPALVQGLGIAPICPLGCRERDDGYVVTIDVSFFEMTAADVDETSVDPRHPIEGMQ